MKNLLSKLTESALDLLFPFQCVSCRKEGALICAACMTTLPRLSPPYCAVCAEPGTSRLCRWCASTPLAADGIRALFLFLDGGPVQKAIYDFKYHGVRAIANQLGGLMADYLASNPVPGDIIVPVPSHPRRQRSRGYNQAALLSRQIGKLTGLPVNEKLLARIKDSPPQAQAASRHERRDNVAGCFACTGGVVGQAVLVVDDIATTGSTISACASALKYAGASTVWGLTVAR